jgi:hypothetical protein
MNGPTALDLNVFQHALDRKGVEADEYEQILHDLRIIEQAALVKIHGNK